MEKPIPAIPSNINIHVVGSGTAATFENDRFPENAALPPDVPVTFKTLVAPAIRFWFNKFRNSCVPVDMVLKLIPLNVTEEKSILVSGFVVATDDISTLVILNPAGVTNAKDRVNVQGAVVAQVTSSSPNVPLGPVIVINCAALALVANIDAASMIDAIDAFFKSFIFRSS